MGAVLSLRTRLIMGAVIWVAVALVATGWALSTLFAQHVRGVLEAELVRELDHLLGDLDQRAPGKPALLHPMSDPRYEQPFGGLYFEVVAGDGTLLRSRSLWDQSLSVPTDTPGDGELHRHAITGPAGQPLMALERKVTWTIGGPVTRVIVAGETSGLRAAERQFDRVLVTGLVVLAAGLLLAIALQVKAGLRPLATLRHQLARTRTGATTGFSGRYPAELQPLVDELDELVRHNTRLVEQARAEAGDLAHRLKTPLAVVAATTAGLAPADDPALLRIQEQVHRMNRQIDLALTRARAVAVAKRPSPVPLEQRLAAIIAALRTLYPDRTVRLAAEAPTAVAVRVDPQDVDDIFGNLLDNACKWAADRVDVTLCCDADHLVVTIEDDGPGLPDHEIGAAFERGIRLDERVNGAGLGLSIVQELVQANHGTVSLGRADLGGLRATVRLRRAGTPQA